MSTTTRVRSFRAGGFESRVVSARDLSAQEVGAWENYCGSFPHLASAFFSPRYTQAAADARNRVYVCVLFQAGRIAGFLPFQFRDALHEWMGCAERVGGEMTDYFGLIADPGLRISANELLRLAGLNHLYFTHLDESQLMHGLSGEHPEVGLRLSLEPGGDTWRGQLRERDPKLVSESGRLERSLERQFGALRFCFAETAWSEPLRNLIRWKGEQYLRTGAMNSFAEPWRVRLLETLAGAQQTNCTGVLSSLHAGETWVASHFGLRSGPVLHYWFPVYNPDLRKFAPGRLLLKNVIQCAPDAGIGLIDRGAGDTHAKRQLTNQEHRFYRGAWYRHGIRSAAFRLHLSLKWRMEGFAKATGNGGAE